VRGRPCPNLRKGDKKVIIYEPEDIGLDLAVRAHAGTSFTPERRGQSEIEEYLDFMAEVVNSFSGWVTEENYYEMAVDLEEFRYRYAFLARAFFASRAACMSTMVTGRSGFDVARNEKRNRWADKHLDRWSSFWPDQFARLCKKYDPKLIAIAPISSDDPDAIEKLAAKIERLEAERDKMKLANKIIRRKRAPGEKEEETEEDKIQELHAEIGITIPTAMSLMEGDYAGRKGFASYNLTNIGAKIRQAHKRIAHLEKQRADKTWEKPITTQWGVVVVEDNVEENRVRVFYPEKPNEEVRAMCRKRGFVFSPSAGNAWQRKRSAVATQYAEFLATIYVPHNRE
jgi:hypothetical protein